MTPDEVSSQERIFDWDGSLQWKCRPFAKAMIGVKLHSLLKTLAPAHPVTGAIRDGNLILGRLLEIYSHQDFLVWYESPKKTAYIVLKGQASPEARLKGWTLALWAAYRFEEDYATGASTPNLLELLEVTLRDISNHWDGYMERIITSGWDINIANLETGSGSRISLTAENPQRVAK